MGICNDESTNLKCLSASVDSQVAFRFRLSDRMRMRHGVGSRLPNSFALSRWGFCPFGVALHGAERIRFDFLFCKTVAVAVPRGREGEVDVTVKVPIHRK